MKKNSKKLLLAGVACALGLSLGVSTHAVYEKELCDAARKGDLAAVQRYVAEGANVNVTAYDNGNGNTALTEAAFGGHLDVAKYLVEHGANILDMVKYLVEHGVDVNAKNTLLMDFAEDGHLDAVKYLVEHGADVNAKDDGETALMKAAKAGHWDVVEWLVEHGANINEKDKSGNTALMYATKNNNFEMVKLLTTKIDSTKISRKECNVCWNKKEANEFAYIFKCGEKYGHHVCKECLQKIIRSNGNPKCPICQQEAIAEKIMEFLREQRQSK